jgi:hypothetical protein
MLRRDRTKSRIKKAACVSEWCLGVAEPVDRCESELIVATSTGAPTKVACEASALNGARMSAD